VVEDEEQVRETVVEQLRGLGYTVEQAANGADGLALAQLQSNAFDLVLTDVVMPGPVSGRDLADAVLSKWPATRIVFMSGYTQDSMGSRGELAPGTRLLSKPFSRRELARTIREALDAAARPGPSEP
jgi:CheY-like chemotaxis protein